MTTSSGYPGRMICTNVRIQLEKKFIVGKYIMRVSGIIVPNYKTIVSPQFLLLWYGPYYPQYVYTSL